MDEQPEDRDDINMTPAQQLMAHTHEMFITAMEYGFSHGEALYLVAAMVCSGPRVPTEGQ